MIGILFSLLAGICMSLQGVFNTKLSEKLGLLQTNAIVQGIGFIFTIIILFTLRKPILKNVKDANKLYFLGGILGVIIVFTVIKGISSLGTTYAISIILIAQLLSAAVIDAFGFFDTQKLPFGLTKILGLIVMVLGMILFKWK